MNLGRAKKFGAGKTQKWIVTEIKKLIDLSFTRSNGRPTKFALKYGIKHYRDYIALFKQIKAMLKRDREPIAFEIIIDMAKSVVGRLTGADPSPEEYFMAFVWTLRRVGLAIDNLKLVEQAVKELQQKFGKDQQDPFFDWLD